MEQRKQARGWHQHFIGYRARINCESVPLLPAWAVRCYLDDPRKVPYLLVWQGPRDGQVKEAVRLAPFVDPHSSPAETYGLVEAKRSDASVSVLRFVWRMLPRNGGRALLLCCLYCSKPCRSLYGWEWDSCSGVSNRVRQITWRCRACAGLRYASEGGALCPPKEFAVFGNYSRPDPWLPWVFSNVDHAIRWLGETRA